MGSVSGGVRAEAGGLSMMEGARRAAETVSGPLTGVLIEKRVDGFAKWRVENGEFETAERWRWNVLGVDRMGTQTWSMRRELFNDTLESIVPTSRELELSVRMECTMFRSLMNLYTAKLPKIC